jgi:hypothetical protein
MDKARVQSLERSGWVLRKPYAPAYGFQKHASFAPARKKRLSFITKKGTGPFFIFLFKSSRMEKCPS